MVELTLLCAKWPLPGSAVSISTGRRSYSLLFIRASAWPQVAAGVALILDTQPKGGAAGGGLSREEAVDRIAEDLLAKVRPCLRLCHAQVETTVWKVTSHKDATPTA